MEVQQGTWDVAVGRGVITVRTGDRRVRLRLPESDDLAAALQAAQAIACEWAMDEVEERGVPGAVTVRRATGAPVSTVMVCAVVAVGLRQALSHDGAGNCVCVQPPPTTARRDRRGSVRATAAVRPLG